MTARTSAPLPSVVKDRLRHDLRSLQRGGVFDVLFAGAVDDQRLQLSDFSGTRSKVLRGLVIEAGRGAGGRALIEHRPVRVDNYRTTRTITHDYLGQITREGIQSLVAAPIMANRRTRGVLYGALRQSTCLGDRRVAALEKAAQALSYGLAVQDEVEFRLHAMAQAEPALGRSLQASEAIIENYLLLREIASEVRDPGLRERIRAVEKSLRQLANPAGQPTAVLTPRETDVLLYASLGCRNAEIAERLSLTTDTVKTYMRNLMAKLGVKTRHAAVVEARRQGIIP